MRITNITIILLIFVLMFSIFVANLANLINVERNYTNDNKNESAHLTAELKMTFTDDHLLWFLQISDLHVSIFHDLSRISDLKGFCEYTVPVINPPVVIASGDLTDAKESNNIGSRQYEGEWIAYRSALSNCINNKQSIWLDIRGNHDNFNVVGLKSKQNYYVNYSIQGPKYPRSYKYNLNYANDKYAFIGIDACIEPGPRRPFNFVGILKEKELENVINLTEQAHVEGVNYTIWFGHYPTSCIMARTKGGIRSVLGRYTNGYAYLCGHFHQLGGLVPNMYTLQQDGFLELELGDWKDNRVYRLIAMDHGLLSFIDVRHRDWPVVLITNPKHALYTIPLRENLNVILQSTHIRILVFSPAKITQVKLKINSGKWIECDNSKGPLYVAPWNAYNYKVGLHEITVFAKDEYGREKIISQPFSLDGTRLSFGILPRFVLMANVSQFFQCMFGVMLVICVVPLCILKYLNYQFHAGKINVPRSRMGLSIIRKLWILSSIDRLFYPLMFYTLYISVGPWSIGYIIENNLGVIFAWGIFINGAFLPGSFTYAYGFLQLLTFHLPMIFLLANICDIRLHIHAGKIRNRSKVRNIVQHTPFFVILLLQILFAYFFWLAYGTMAFLIGPLRTWSIVLAIWLWFQAIRLPEKCMRDALKVWCPINTVISSHEDVNSHHTN